MLNFDLTGVVCPKGHAPISTPEATNGESFTVSCNSCLKEEPTGKITYTVEVSTVPTETLGYMLTLCERVDEVLERIQDRDVVFNSFIQIVRQELDNRENVTVPSPLDLSHSAIIQQNSIPSLEESYPGIETAGGPVPTSDSSKDQSKWVIPLTQIEAKKLQDDRNVEIIDSVNPAISASSSNKEATTPSTLTP